MQKGGLVITVLIGGAAGEGSHEASLALSKALVKLGQEVYVGLDYQSLIRGGSNFSRVSFSTEKVWCDRRDLDVLMALSLESLEKHLAELKKGGIILFDGEAPAKIKNKACVLGLPASGWVKELKAQPIMRTSVFLGALGYCLGIGPEVWSQVFNELFGVKAAVNIALAQKGYDFAAAHKFCKLPLTKKAPAAREVLDGNVAFALGLAKAGLKYYFGYPMTPATGIFHYLARRQKELGLKTVQAENEIAVANMALGAIYAGAPSAVGTSGGGFDLMEEAFSFAGMAEIPLVVGLSGRAGPSTGVPTYTGQADLAYARHAGHGEFPRLILAPGDPTESYELAMLAMQLAWEYQIPAIVLLDRHLSENTMALDLKLVPVKSVTFKPAKNSGAAYKRYAITPDGISPLAFPGAPGAAVKLNSYEHDETGLVTEDPAAIKAMQEKRYEKLPALFKEKIPGFKIYGDKKSKKAVIFWGSTKGAVLEAAKFLHSPVKFIQVVSLEPFFGAELLKELKGVKKVIDVEGNFEGQLAALIKEKTGLGIKDKVLKYDARPFDPLKLAGELNKLLK